MRDRTPKTHFNSEVIDGSPPRIACGDNCKRSRAVILGGWFTSNYLEVTCKQCCLSVEAYERRGNKPEFMNRNWRKK